jgi:hypothetical protein
VLPLATTRDSDGRKIALSSERTGRSTLRLISDSGLPALAGRDQAHALRAQPQEDEPALEKTGARVLPDGSDEHGKADASSASAAERNAHVADAKPTAS